MANPFDVLVTADILAQNPLGVGGSSIVYPHPNDPNLAVRFPGGRMLEIEQMKGKAGIPSQIKPMPVKDVFPDKNFGQPVARMNYGNTEYVPHPSAKDQSVVNYPKGVEIIKRVEGEPMAAKSYRDYVHKINALRKLPQESFNSYRQDYKTLLAHGADVDLNSGNVLFDGKNLKHIDVGAPTYRYKDTGGKLDWSKLPEKIKSVELFNGLFGAPDVENATAQVEGVMSPKRVSAIRSGLGQIASKLNAASKVIPALGAFGVYDTYKQMEDIQNKGGGWITPAKPRIEDIQPL